MQVTVIGDLHGRTNWIDIVNEHNNQNFIFLGDYVDPYAMEFIQEDEAIENFEMLIDFKKNFNSKVTLLIGNHDAQYLFYPDFVFRKPTKYLQDYIHLYQDNRTLFQFAIQKNNYLFTHAGVSNGWFNEYYRLFNYFGLETDMSNLAMILNKIGKDGKWREIYDNVSSLRGGKDKFGSPIWADRMELYQDHLTGFHQVCGHNKVADIMKVGDSKSSITFVDCLFSKDKGLTLSV